MRQGSRAARHTLGGATTRCIVTSASVGVRASASVSSLPNSRPARMTLRAPGPSGRSRSWAAAVEAVRRQPRELRTAHKLAERAARA